MLKPKNGCPKAIPPTSHLYIISYVFFSKIVLWNVHGFNSDVCINHYRKHTKYLGLDLICVMETKIDSSLLTNSIHLTSSSYFLMRIVFTIMIILLLSVYGLSGIPLLCSLLLFSFMLSSFMALFHSLPQSSS